MGTHPGATHGAIARAAAAAAVHDGRCLLCEHRCGVDRGAGELGTCRAGTTARVFRHRVEYGEEPEIVPSHLFYLSGCDLRCTFCIAEEKAFDPRIGTPLSGAFLSRAAAWGRARGSRTLQWVGGEPTIHLPAILRAMADCDDLPPVVWKSDFHATPAALRLLDGIVDTFIADFKFGTDACATRIGSVDGYVAIVTRNLAAVAATGSRLIVRHLLMPGHVDCCFRPVARWLADNLPGVPFSLRDGYQPRWLARHDPDLARLPEADEVSAAFAEARMLGLCLTG